MAVTRKLKKTAAQAAKGKQDKAAAARGGTKANKGKAMSQRSSVVKGHQKDLTKIAGEVAFNRTAEKTFKNLRKRGVQAGWMDIAGAKGNIAERKAIKKTTKSFKGTK